MSRWFRSLPIYTVAGIDPRLVRWLVLVAGVELVGIVALIVR